VTIILTLMLATPSALKKVLRAIIMPYGAMINCSLCACQQPKTALNFFLVLCAVAGSTCLVFSSKSYSSSSGGSSARGVLVAMVALA
jgi:hypothetical protein